MHLLKSRVIWAFAFILFMGALVPLQAQSMPDIMSLHSSSMTAPSDKKEIDHLQKLAKHDDVYAQYEMGFLYLVGDKLAGQDYKKATEFITHAANGNFVPAYAVLSAMYFYGLGFEVDYNLAFSWAAKSAEQGSKLGQNILGVYYQKAYGTSQDKVRAYELFKSAAGQGDVNALTNLAFSYEMGQGFAQN
jgi:TPR repeat protein